MTLRRRLDKLEASRGGGHAGPLYLFTTLVERDDNGSTVDELYSALVVRRLGGESVQLFRESGETEGAFEARVHSLFEGVKPALRLGPHVSAL